MVHDVTGDRDPGRTIGGTVPFMHDRRRRNRCPLPSGETTAVRCRPSGGPQPPVPETTPTPRIEPVTIREQVRAAVGRAWDRAVAAGALPTWPEEATKPTVEVERPADPVHGDFASNLAMKLARPYRMAPSPSHPPWPRNSAPRQHATRGRPRSVRRRSHRRGSSTSACATTRSRRRSPGSSPIRRRGAACR